MKRTSITIIMIIAAWLALESSPLPAAEMTPAGIFNRDSGSVVLIGAFKDRKKANLGSGFIISPNGLIVTNYHVIKNTKMVMVKLKDNKMYPANMLLYDENKDIAILKIQALGLKSVILGNSDTVSVGERVLAIGNPLGLESTISDGLISAVRKAEDGSSIFQTTVPVSTGSSGCPIFNYSGEVIGVTVSSRTDGQNLNFAIPINSVRPLAVRTGYNEPSRPAPGYTVKQKDTLYSIAKKYDTTVDALMALNDLPGPSISVGQVLKIPDHRKR